MTDDGLPAGSSVATTWTHVGGTGAGSVTFTDPAALDPTVTVTPDPGTYVLRLTASDGVFAVYDELTLTLEPEPGSLTTIDIRIAAGVDDAEESTSTGAVARAGNDLELVDDGGDSQLVGLRFPDVTVPQGAVITTAWVQFQADQTGSGDVQVIIQGEDAGSAAPFARSAGNISARLRTIAAMPWSPAPWPQVGEAGPDQRTPNLASVIAEIISHPGWTAGNAMVLIVAGSDTSERVAESYNGDAAGAPLLHIEYVTGPHIDVTPTPHDYGPHAPGTSITQTFTVANTGTADLVVGTATLTGPHASEFALVSGAAGATLSPGATHTIDVSFTPTTVGAKSATLSIPNDDPNENPALVPLSGTATVLEADIDVTPTVYDYGLLPNGATATQAFAVTNNGAAHLIVGTPTVAGTDASEFTVVTGAAGFTVPPGTTGTIDASFTPFTPGAKSATLSIPSNDPDENPILVPLSGTAGAGVPTTVDIRIANGADDAEEDVSTGAISFASSDLELIDEAGDSQLVGLRFPQVPVPQGALITSAWVQFQVDETGSAPVQVIFQGEYIDSATPFENVSGNIAARLRTAAAVPWSPAPWSQAGEAGLDQRTPNLAPVIAEIISHPGWTADNAMVLIVSGSDTTERVAEAYDGDAGAAPLLHIEYALDPNIEVTPTAYDYGPQPPGTSVAHAFIVANTGTADLVVGTATLTGPHASEFALVSGAAGATLSPGATHTIDVTFTPTTVGAKTATLTIANDDPDENPLPVALSGTGVAADIDVTPTAYDYGDVVTGTSVTQAFTATNSGTADLVVGPSTLTGPDASEFTVVTRRGRCDASARQHPHRRGQVHAHDRRGQDRHAEHPQQRPR